MTTRDWDDDFPFGLPFALEEYEARMARVKAAMGGAGIDLLIADIAQSWRRTGAAICEVNAQPQFATPADAHLHDTREHDPSAWTPL